MDVWSPADVEAVPVGGAVQAVEAGDVGTTCGILSGGKVRCWGQSVQGALGYGSPEDVGATNTPASVGDVQLPEPVVDVTVAAAHVCVLMQSGKVRCWGFGSEGRLGYPSEVNIGDDETPMQAKDVDIGAPVTDLDAAGSHTCALTKTGTVRCWGNGRNGQLGYGDRTNVGMDVTPAQVGDVKLPGPAKQIDTGLNHTCALLEAGDVMCWGASLGNGASSSEPVELGFE
jgi:alpha-tubulin suppressor-like RCC1 family protein